MANPNVLDWTHFQDIQIPDAETRERFQSYFREGSYIEALSLLKSKEAQLKGKAYIADVINVITELVYGMEKRYFHDVVFFLDKLGVKLQKLIDNIGNAATWRGSITYIPYNAVIYEDVVYLNIKESLGILPTDTDYWLKLGLKGEQGASGIDVVPKYIWNPSTSYKTNEVVAYKDKLYIAIRANKSKEPDKSKLDWLVFVASSVGKITVSKNPPQNYMHNSIWIQLDENPKQLLPENTVSGKFKRWKEPEGIWEEMYPFVLQSMTGNILRKNFHMQIYIKPDDWGTSDIYSRQFVINDGSISKNDEVVVIPELEGLTKESFEFFRTFIRGDARDGQVIVGTNKRDVPYPFRLNIYVR